MIDNINFIGFTAPIKYYYDDKNIKDFNNLLDGLKTENNKYNILLCHSPITISKNDILKNRNIDLILCGHTHGGAVFEFLRPVLKNNGLISPNNELFPKNVYGQLRINNTDIIITSGLKVTPFKLINKLFPLEIVKINLTFKKN